MKPDILISSTKMVESDNEIGSEMLNSSQSQSSMTSTDSCSSFSRLSFDAPTAATSAPDLSTSRVVCRPHRSSDRAWAAIRSFDRVHLGPRDFKLVRRIGRGDIGTVYLCSLGEDNEMYAMKVVDKQMVAEKNKVDRAETEKRILRVLDHPFLPNLYADFDAYPHYSCIVMDYCSGGDLHSLLHRQPDLSFSVASARFYAAEVVLALEYLHMLGIVYRDLKPENVLIRADGHIMLSDFDLSFESTSSPSLDNTPPAIAREKPACLLNRLLSLPRRTASGGYTCRFVAEPVGARSRSFVGTHEYVSPEVAAGRAHGSAVDWWAYGIFLYELLYGRTPFVGPNNESTLRNVVRQPLSFPGPVPRGTLEASARDLIAGLLVKDPSARLGSRRGAADVKGHSFFKGMNLALMRSCRPPMIPDARLARTSVCTEREKPARFEFF